MYIHVNYIKIIFLIYKIEDNVTTLFFILYVIVCIMGNEIRYPY